jgi:hypothetical protein
MPDRSLVSLGVSSLLRGTEVTVLGIGTSNVATSQSITSATYAALATAQDITLTTGTSALIFMSFMYTRPSPESYVYMACAVSGATTRAAADTESAYGYTYSTSDLTITKVIRFTDLTAGSNTFSAQFRRNATNCNAYNRSFTVIAI